MTVRSLENTPVDDIIACFLIAFKGYFVKMPTDHDYYKQRWKSSGVKWEWSYGMFVKERLVGLINTALDERQGELIAYNAGTGVLPEYRGRRIVKSIYEYAIPQLKNHGVSKCVLEVIKENHIAIRSYESIGFRICKHYKCYGGEISVKPDAKVLLKEVFHDDMDWEGMKNQGLYSWDHHSNSLRNGNYKYFQILNGNRFESYFVINQDYNYVAQLESFGNDPKHWDRLFQAINTLSGTIKINNIDARLTHKIRAIQMAGLTNTVDQYEMELDLVDLD